MRREDKEKKGKKSIIAKTLSNRFLSLRGSPKGCFSVYVGPERERFVVSTRWVNHPLFKSLLDEAEMEFGFDNGGGALDLPCDVGLFREVLVEMRQEDVGFTPRCNFACRFGKRHEWHKLVKV